jgi:hypothetical protein
VERLVRRRAEHRRGEPQEFRRCEVAQFDPPGLKVLDHRAVGRATAAFAGAGGHHQRDRQFVDAKRQVRQPLHGYLVCQVQVVHHDEHRPVAGKGACPQVQVVQHLVA